MKKYVLRTIVFFFCLGVVVCSCKKEVKLQKEQPSINFSTASTIIGTDTLRLILVRDTAITIDYEVETIGEIKWLYQTLLGVKTTNAEASGQNKYKKTINLSVTATDNVYELLVSVVNSEGGRISKKLTVAAKKYTPPQVGTGAIVSYSGKEIGGDISPLASRFDLDLGVDISSASVNSDPAVKDAVDLFYTNSVIKDNDGSGRWPDGFGTRFGTTTLDAAAFDNIVFASQINGLTGNLREVTIENGKVYFFVTRQGTKGVISITEYNTAADEIVFSVKYATKPFTLHTDKELSGLSSPSSIWARMDLEQGQGYSGGTINGDPTLIPLIDVAMDVSKISNNDGSGRWPNSMGSKFSATNLTAADFASMSNTQGLNALSLVKVNEIAVDVVGRVIYFETSSNNRGLILIKSYVPVQDEIKFDIKVTQ